MYNTGVISKSSAAPIPFTWVPRQDDPAANSPLQKETDPRLDGCFLGANGAVYSKETNWRDIPVITPNNGVPATQTCIVVNGILCDLALHMADLQAMANTGCNVIGIHNATKGMLRDMGQCLLDKFRPQSANNGATQTTEKVSRDLLEVENPPHLVGHSQGAICVSNALENIQNQGVSPEQMSKLNVTTLAGASWTFPKGPHYRHFVNRLDVVPQGAGVGPYAWAQKSEQTEVHYFSRLQKPTHLPMARYGLVTYLARAIDQSSHGLGDIYAPEVARVKAQALPKASKAD